MKNKVTVIALALILGLSSTSALAAERVNYTNFNIFDLFTNYGFYNYEPTYTNEDTANTVDTYTEYAPITNRAQAPSQERAATYNTEEVTRNETRTNTANTANTTTSSPSVSNYERRVAELVNVERQKNGLGPLTLDASISNVARLKSKDMADNNYFAHQSPTHGSAGNMLTNHGIKWSAWGENIAAGQSTPEEVVRQWMNSPGHRENILSPNFSKIGVGYVNSARPHWTQMFTN